ncbi:MAG: glycosyltransferase [Bacteroidetes bacterium]|nr:MAG: glycosyltransferase [Bacteroidota bacterium]
MNVAFLTTTFENTTNGPAKFARLINKHPGFNNKKVVIFTEDISQNYQDVVKVKIPSLLNFSGVGFLYRLFAYFFKVIRYPGVEVVVSNNTMYGFLFHLFSRKKVVGFINDDQHIVPAFQLKYSALRSYIFSKLEKFALKRNDITVVNSKHLHQTLSSAYEVPSDKIFTLYKGIEIEKNKKLCLDKHEEDEMFRVLFVKTNYKIGGLYYLLKALEGLNGVHLDIVTSPRVKKSRLVKLARNCESVKFYHNLPQSSVFDLMDKAHCLCIPSEKEALGVANMEGMYHGCAILSTNVGGIPEVLDYGNAGILVPFGDENILREKLLYLMNNREIRMQYVLKGFEAVQRFSIQNSIKSFYQMLDLVK